MRRILWITQLDALHAALGSGASILPKIKAQGFTGLALKILDGADWMVEYDHDQYAISGFQELAVWQAACNAAGLTLDAWVNVTGAWQSALAWYAQFCRDFPGRLILDLENGPKFFGPGDPTTFLLALGNMLNGPTADSYYIPRVSICYDPRRETQDASPWIGASLGYFGTHMPQIYGEYGITPAQVPVVGRPVEPILSVNAGAANWHSVLRDPTLGSAQGRTGYGVFVAPLTDANLIAAVGDLA